MKKEDFFKVDCYKSLLFGCTLLLGAVSPQSSALPIEDLPQRVQDLLPGNVTGYYVVGSTSAPYGTSASIAFLPDGRIINGDSGMPGAIYVNGSNGTTPVIVLGDSVTVNTTAEAADGLRSNGGTPGSPGYIIAGDNLNIKVTGRDSDGINAGYFTESYVFPATGSNIINVGNGLVINTEGSEGRGISVYQTSSLSRYDNTNIVTVGNGARITTKGDSSEGIRAGGISTATRTVTNTVTTGDDTTIKTEGSKSIGLRADNATIQTGKNTLVTTEQNGSHGVYATGAIGNITLGSDAKITTGGTDTTYSIYSASGGTVTLKGGAIITNASTQAANSYAMYSTGNNSHIDGNAAGTYKIIGDIYATSNGMIGLNMASDSSWTGAAYLGTTGTTKLVMASDSVWNMTGNSKITSLDSQNGTVNFQSTADNYYTLTTGGLSGNGGFAMKVDMVGQQGDLINVTGSNVSGSHTLTIANNGAATTDGTEVLTVVKTLDNTQGSFTSNTVEVGAYEYKLRQKDDNKEWELYGALPAPPEPPQPPGPAPEPPTPAPPPTPSTTAEASVNLLSNNYLLSYIDTQTLLQRMGQLRASNNQRGDFWIKGFGGKLSSFGGSNISGFNMSYKGTQMGIDRLVNTNDGRLYVGAMMGMTDSDPNYRGGHGATKGYHFGLYGTYMADNGLYVDGVLKYTKMKNHFNVKDTLGDIVTGKGTSGGYSASIETGKRFYLSDSKKADGYYVEPQAQITYGHQGGMNVDGSNGLKTRLSSYNSVLGRASIIAGYSIEGATRVDVYIKTGYVKEFDGKTSYQFNQGEELSHSFKGGWWDNGIGINAQIKSKHNIYADINYAKGSRFDQKYFNLGYRYSF